jgi:SEC-C motif-containing protein
VTLLGTWNGETPWRIYRTGDPIRPRSRNEDAGEGVTWRCTCPHGEPQDTRAANKRAGYPCRHLQSIWHYAEQGLYDPHVDWTPEGIEEGRRCRCRSGKPCPLRFGPPLQRPPDVPPLGAALNKPCPCGSGRKFKKCEGFGPNRPNGPAHPLLQPPELAEPSAAPPPWPAPPPLAERRRRARAEARAQREERRETVLGPILERIHAAEEARRSRRAYLARSKKAQAVIAKAEGRKK